MANLIDKIMELTDDGFELTISRSAAETDGEGNGWYKTFVVDWTDEGNLVDTVENESLEVALDVLLGKAA